MADEPDLDALPQAVVTHRKRLRISIIWIIPLLAALVARALGDKAANREVATGTVLAFATGLPAFSMTKVFQPGFYAREDTRTPMRFAIVSVAVNIAASIVLSLWLGHVGIALATSLAAWVYCEIEKRQTRLLAR